MKHYLYIFLILVSMSIPIHATQFGDIPASQVIGNLTKTDDTNVTLTLGGTPTNALLKATSLTLGWTGQLSLARGGTGASLSDPAANTLLGWDDTDNAIGFITVGSGLTYTHATHTLASSGTVTPAALTKTDDTNVTLTLGGTPATALLQASSITVGWAGTLSQARGGFGKSTASTTDGQIPIGKTSDGTWNVNTITAGSGISVTNGAGAITITNTASVAPDTASYITKVAEAGLSGEFALASLATGILKNTTTTGVPSIATAGTDYADLAFKTFAVSGQSDVVADSAADTLTLAAGTNITLTTNAGTDTVTITAAGSAQSHSVTFVVDGSGAVLSTGTKNAIKIPFGGTLTGWLLNGSPSGSVTVDIFRSADGAGLPVTSIIGGGGTKPALSTATENSSTSFTSWTSTTLTAKDNMAISLSGITTSTYCALTLYFQ